MQAQINRLSKVHQFTQFLTWVDNLEDYKINKSELEWYFEDGDLWQFNLNNELIGGCITSIQKEYAMISDFVINKDLRNIGNGSRFLLLLENEFTALLCNKIKLHPIEKSKPFWKKQGYYSEELRNSALELWCKLL